MADEPPALPRKMTKRELPTAARPPKGSKYRLTSPEPLIEDSYSQPQALLPSNPVYLGMESEEEECEPEHHRRQSHASDTLGPPSLSSLPGSSELGAPENKRGDAGSRSSSIHSEHTYYERATAIGMTANPVYHGGSRRDILFEKVELRLQQHDEESETETDAAEPCSASAAGKVRSVSSPWTRSGRKCALAGIALTLLTLVLVLVALGLASKNGKTAATASSSAEAAKAANTASFTSVAVNITDLTLRLGQLESLNTNLQIELDAAKQRLVQLELLVPRVSKLQTDLSATTVRFAKLEPRMGTVEARVGRVEGRVGGVESRAGKLESRMGAVESRVSRLE